MIIPEPPCYTDSRGSGATELSGQGLRTQSQNPLSVCSPSHQVASADPAPSGPGRGADANVKRSWSHWWGCVLQIEGATQSVFSTLILDHLLNQQAESSRQPSEERIWGPETQSYLLNVLFPLCQSQGNVVDTKFHVLINFTSPRAS